MKKKLIMIGIDGANRDILYSLIEKEELKFFTQIAKDGTIVENATTLFPATTVPCIASMYTGCYFKNHGILNNNWLDRFHSPPVFKKYISSPGEVLKSLDKKLFGLPTIILPDANFGGQINNEISKDVQTIYEVASENGLKSYAFFHYIGKGATKWIRPRIRDMLLFAYIEKFKKGYEPFEKAMIDVTITHLKKFLPDIVSIYFGTNDGNSHRNGVSDQVRYFKELIDPQLLRLKNFLKIKYPDFDFYYTVCADHGQTGFEEKYINNLWTEDFKNVIKSISSSLKVDGGENIETTDVDVIFTFGNGASVGVYIRDKKTKNWRDNPDFEEDVLPIANKFLEEDFTEFILIRKNFNERYKVMDKKGEISELEKYFEDKDKYINPVERIENINSPKGPDIIVFLDYEKYQISKDFKKGNHGSLFKDDSYIPMIFSGKEIKKGKIDKGSIIDYAPTCAKILGFEMKKTDGKILDIFS
jgi:predicted AlkP superfamily pyrophosphatase or phosphodiesterase